MGDFFQTLATFYHVVFSTVFPLYAVVATGYVMRRFGGFDQRLAAMLLRIVFYFSMPALMFSVIASTPFAEVLNFNTLVLLFAFMAGQLLMFIIGLLSAKTLFRVSSKDAFMGGLNASISNTALLGIPLLIALFGNSVVVPASVTVVVITLIIMPLTYLALEHFFKEDDSHQVTMWAFLWNIIKSPMVFVPIVGMVFSGFNLTLPHVAISYIHYISSGTVLLALFAIGMTLNSETLKGNWSFATLITFLKLLVLPALMLLIMRQFDVPTMYIIVGVLVAAIPTAKIVLLLSVEYNANVQRTSSVLYLSHVAGFFTLMFWVIVLNLLYPEYFLYFANIYFG